VSAACARWNLVRRRPQSSSVNVPSDRFRPLRVTFQRHAFRATCRGPGPPEQGEAARRKRRAHGPRPRVGCRHQLRTEQRTSADGLGGRARWRGVPRTPRPASRRGHQISGPSTPRPSPQPLGRPRRPQIRHSS